jgi:hypothetical protein
MSLEDAPTALVRHPAPQAVDLPAAGERPACGETGRRQDMSKLSEVRPEVVEAIVGVLKGGDPAELPPGATAAEKAAAKDTYLSDFVAERGKRDRQSQAWELLLTRSYDEAPSWQQIFDDLDPEVRPELERLYDALPAGAQEEYARRFGVPSGV